MWKVSIVKLQYSYIRQCHLISRQSDIDLAVTTVNGGDIFNGDSKVLRDCGYGVALSLKEDFTLHTLSAGILPYIPVFELLLLFDGHLVIGEFLYLVTLAVQLYHGVFTVSLAIHLFIIGVKQYNVRTMPYKCCGRKAHRVELELSVVFDCYTLC